MSRSLLWMLWMGTAGTASSTRITQQPLDQVVVSGRSAVLSCAVSNYTGIVQWTKDGLALGMGNGLPAWPRYRIVGETERGEHDLEIQQAELSDDAVYECQATEVALRSERAKLTVLIPPDDPLIDGEPEILLQAGTPYNLTCLAKGAKPAAAIVWYRDGALQEGAAVSQDVMNDGKRETTVSALTIIPTDVDIGRVYTCRTSNQALPAGKDTIVRLNVHHVPTVTLSIHPQKVREGDRVVFTCTASANPKIESYRWSKGGVPIDGARGSVYDTPVDYTYFTEPVSCEVQNAVGSTNVSSLVDVEFGPRLLQESQTTTADLGDTVMLTCIWVGNPPLILTWTKRGSNMVLSNSNHLYLKSVTQADSGNYVCKAIVPRIGVGEREVTLHVDGPPVISSEAVQYAVQGDRGKVECYIASTPLPDRIAWSWQEHFLETGSFDRYTVETVSTDQSLRSTLLIDNVAELDFQTRYNCTAWNGFGPGTALIQLNKEDVLPIGIIIGVTVGVGIVLSLSLIGLALVLYRRHKRSRKDVTLGKPDLKVETVINDPQSMSKELDEDGSNMSTATRVMKAVYSAFKDDMDLKSDLRSDTIDTREDSELKDPTNGYYNVRAQDDRPASRTLLYSDYRPPGGPRFDARPPSRLSHASGYAQAEGAGQLPYEPYPYPGYPPYGGGYPRVTYDPYDAKFAGPARYSYCSSQHSEHGRSHHQRMQTHV